MSGRPTGLALLTLLGVFALAPDATAQAQAATATEGPPRVAEVTRSCPGDAPQPDACAGCGGFDFAKVPPVRVFPRPGMFPITPTGPGYYSLLDALRGEARDAPAPFGYPPFALMQPSFFDADWRYLDNTKTPPQDFLDRLKRVRVGDD
ncbi:MAG TPA: hypothetical protein VM529_07630, partial [Gemmata sp.]|nr:hypothetical protein [Gemmata sp.]